VASHTIQLECKCRVWSAHRQPRFVSDNIGKMESTVRKHCRCTCIATERFCAMMDADKPEDLQKTIDKKNSDKRA
jgi:hypothetical protein